MTKSDFRIEMGKGNCGREEAGRDGAAGVW